MAGDPIEHLVQSWTHELPDLDVAAMATVARLNRLSLLVNRRIEDALAANGSSLADFDVLSALRRDGAPYRLMPSELARRVMLSPSGMTHRIDQLETAGLVERQVDPANRRTMPVALTDEGVRLAEVLVRIVVEVETAILRPLSADQRATLDSAARRVIEGLAASG